MPFRTTAMSPKSILVPTTSNVFGTCKQAAWQRPLVSSFQRLLRETQVGVWFFNAIAKPRVTSTLALPVQLFGAVRLHALRDASTKCITEAAPSPRRTSKASCRSATATRRRSPRSWWTAY